MCFNGTDRRVWATQNSNGKVKRIENKKWHKVRKKSLHCECLLPTTTLRLNTLGLIRVLNHPFQLFISWLSRRKISLNIFVHWFNYLLLIEKLNQLLWYVTQSRLVWKYRERSWWKIIILLKKYFTISYKCTYAPPHINRSEKQSVKWSLFW